MDFEEYCESLGIDPTAMTIGEKSGLQSAWRAARGVPYASPVTSPTTPALDIQASVDRYCQMHQGNPEKIKQLRELGERAKAEGWDRQATELAILRLDRTAGPFSHAPASTPNTTDVIEAALLLNTGHRPENLERHGGYSQHVIDAASSSRHRQTSLHDLVRMQLHAAGIEAPVRVSEHHIRTAFELDAGRYRGNSPVMHSGPSTLSISGIISNAANKSALMAFAQANTTWGMWCARRPLKDFKTATQYRLAQGGHLEVVPASGEIKHGTLSESDYSIQADQMALMIGIDRKQWINDDLSMLEQVPGMLARKASIGVERAVYTLLLSNPGGTTSGFFSTANANYVTTGSILSVSGLSIAIKAMHEQVDDDDVPLFLDPKFLIVPPALDPVARQLLVSTNTVGGDSPTPSSNPHTGRLTPVVAPYASVASGLPNASDAGYWVVTGPGDFSPIAVGFVGGQESPMVQMGDFDFNRLGVAWRVVYDFGVGLLEPKGGVLATGAAAG